MKNVKKLTLRKETVVSLGNHEMRQLKGGESAPGGTNTCKTTADIYCVPQNWGCGPPPIDIGGNSGACCGYTQGCGGSGGNSAYCATAAGNATCAGYAC